jgi:hypothetical protein
VIEHPKKIEVEEVDFTTKPKSDSVLLKLFNKCMHNADLALGGTRVTPCNIDTFATTLATYSRLVDIKLVGCSPSLERNLEVRSFVTKIMEDAE